MTEFDELRRTGLGGSFDPMSVVKRLPRNMLNKILLPKEHDCCWEWIAWKREGYGLVKIKGKQHATHRITYQIAFGSIPEGREIDHLCRNHSCCNPAHLEAVSHRENVIRGVSLEFNLGKTHCPAGHEYNDHNTYVSTNERGSRERTCKVCRRLAKLKWRRANGIGPKRKTHCKNGHLLPNIADKRECPICRAARWRAYKERNK